METSADRLKHVSDAIAHATRKAGRPVGSVRLVAVSKTQEAAAILPIIKAGQLVFAENRVQEAKGKWPALRRVRAGIELHLIGPLQSNKCADAVALFDVIETVDREKIAMVLADEIKRQGRHPRLMVQVNTGDEPQKSGVSVGESEAFVRLCREKYGLEISGLMCIPPIDEDPAPHFARLAALAGKCGVSELSMGMSGDFETAIAAGATHVRIGTAIFGQRPVG